MAPDGWCSANLDSLARVNPEQLGNRTDPEHLLEYLDIAAIERPGVIGATRTLRFSEAPSRARRLARNGDILVSTVRPYLRNFARIREALDNLVVSTGYAVIRPGSGVDGRFLYQHILSAGFIDFLKPRMSGSNYPAVTANDVEAYPLSLPPLPEQRKIAAILSSVDDAVEKTQAVIDQVQIVKRGLMQELLTRGLPGRHTRFKRTEMGEVPEGWVLKTVAEIGKVVTGSTPNTNNCAFWNGMIPFVTPGDLGRTKKINVTGRSVSEEGLAQVKEIPPGAVMVTCIGAIGKIGIATERCCTNQQINSIIPGDSVISEYLHYTLSLTSRTLVALAGVTAVPIVSKSRFLTLRILVPSLAEQEQIVRVLSGVDHMIDINRVRLETLTEVKIGLMSTLLTGKLRVTPAPEAA